MVVHRNAALSLVKRRELVEMADKGVPVAQVSASFRVSFQTVQKWLRRWREEGDAGLFERSSRPKASPRAIPEAVRANVIALRREHLTMQSITERTGVSKATVSRALAKEGLSRLKALYPKEPANRYEHSKPGEMLHVDVKKLGRFDMPGHRAVGRANRASACGAGHDFLFVAVDDYSRLALVGVYPDETKTSAADFVERTVLRMDELGVPVQRILTDNARAFKSDAAKAVYAKHKVKHKTTRPYRPRTNGKAERFIQTLLREWAYAAAYSTSLDRNAELGPFLERYNRHRPHSALGGKSPITRLHNLLKLDN